MTALLKLADVIDAFVAAAGKFATLIVLVMVALVSWNVVSRYIVGGASVAMQEAEWHLLAIVALLGITVLMRENGHVRVDMIYERLSPRGKHALDLFSMIVGVVVSIMIIRYSAGFFESSYSIGEGSPDPGGLPMRYLLKALIPAGFAIFGLQCLAHAIRHAAALSRREA
ncbi:MAG: TRAP transporter small permease subunit [Rhodomicrobium sp.]|nr:TRAP transporter small permease subunit [Rhodomicrobium sp.]